MVLVTGGTGFIGSCVTRALLARGQSVVCFDLRPDPARLGAAASSPGLTVVEGDIARIGDLLEAIRAHGVNRVIHTAAVLTATCQAAPAAAVRVNVVGTTHVFEAARLSDVVRVVYASSLVVHGSQGDHGDRLLDEAASYHPHTFYAHTKVANEATAAGYTARFGLDCRGLRIGAPFGPGGQMGRPGAEVTRLATLAATGAPVAIRLARGESPPSTYVDDIAEIFVRLAFATTLTSPVYLCSVAAVPIDEVAEAVRRLVPAAAITFGDEGARVTLPYRIDARRLEQDIGFRPPAIAIRLRDHINAVRRAHGLLPV
jgi:nucleoside-diphosphate-sugar epimerase